MKRFWDLASVADRPDGFAILLDGKTMRLPGGNALVVTSRPLAEAIAAEWQAAGGTKGGEVGGDDVPLTGLAGNAQERIAADPAAIVAALAAYGGNDLLCYRAPDKTLAQREARHWQPWLDWAERELGAKLAVTVGVMPIAQDQQALTALHRAVALHDAAELAGLGLAVPLLGSLVLGLALSTGQLDAAEAHRLATLDETFQAELWGEDEAAVARRDRIAGEVALAGRYLALVREGMTVA